MLIRNWVKHKESTLYLRISGSLSFIDYQISGSKSREQQRGLEGSVRWMPIWQVLCELNWMFDRGNKEKERLLISLYRWPSIAAWSTSREGTLMPTKRWWQGFTMPDIVPILCMLIIVTILIAASIVSAFKRSSVHVHILNYKIQFICWLTTDGDSRKGNFTARHTFDGQWAWIPSAGAWRAAYNLTIDGLLPTASECTWTRRLSLPAIAVPYDAAALLKDNSISAPSTRQPWWIINESSFQWEPEHAGE